MRPSAGLSEVAADLQRRPTKIPAEALPPAVQHWLRATKARSENTEDAYHRAISSWLYWCIDNERDPHTPRLVDVEDWMESLGHLAHRSVNVRVAACSSLYRRLLLEKRVDFNPFAAIVSYKVSTNRLATPALSQDSVRAMLNAAKRRPHPADYAVMELLFTTAARASEIASANLADLSSDDHGAMLTVTRKGGELQDLPVTPKAAAAVRTANRDRATADSTDAPLLVAPKGGRYSRHTISRLVRQCAEAAHLDPELVKKIAAHATRRTAITRFVDGGGDLRTAQTLAGHKDPRTTEGYVRAEKDREKHAAAAMTLSAMFH